MLKLGHLVAELKVMGIGVTTTRVLAGTAIQRERSAVVDPPQIDLQMAQRMAVELGTFSKAKGPWEIDVKRAVRDAEATLAQVDWSKPVVALWLPGSNGSGVHAGFGAAMHDAFSGAVSVSALVYEASWHMRRSLPTGLLTLKLVLAAIQARKGADSVVMCGESQGAWIAGEALADAAIRPVVRRAALLGHPWLAATHYDSSPGGRRDRDVLEVNHAGDPVAEPIQGDATTGFDALCAIRTFNIGALPVALQGLLQNPKHGAMLLKSLIGATILKPFYKDPHNYADDMTAAARFLASAA